MDLPIFDNAVSHEDTDAVALKTFPPDSSQETRSIDQDVQHLQLLSIFHYVCGGVMALFGCFPVIHLVMGIVIVAGGMDMQGGPPPEFGWIFIAVAVVIMAFIWTMAITIIVAGRKLATRRAYTFCLVVAGIECLFMPLGTVLGVFTIVVLIRPSVKPLFGIQ